MKTFQKNATSIIKVYQVLASFGFDNVDIYLQNGPFLGDVGIVISNESRGLPCVAYINQNYFDSYGCPPPQKLSKIIIK